MIKSAIEESESWELRVESLEPDEICQQKRRPVKDALNVSRVTHADKFLVAQMPPWLLPSAGG
jgi:hypothetical protein